MLSKKTQCRLAVLTTAALMASGAGNAHAANPSAWPANNSCASTSKIVKRCNIAKPLSFKVRVDPLAYVAHGKWLPTYGHRFPVTIKASCNGGSKSVTLHPKHKLIIESKNLKGFNGLLARSRRCHIEASAHPSIANPGSVDWVSTNISARFRL